MQTQPDYPKHYCGVFGIFGHPNAAELTYYGLYALQHRGQESAGIVTCHEGKFCTHHGMGLVPQIFNDPKSCTISSATWPSATRATPPPARPNLRNAQPLTVDCARGQIAIAHNGNLTNAAALRDELEAAAPFSRPPWTARSSSCARPAGHERQRNSLRADAAPHRRRVFARHHDGKRIDRRARSASVSVRLSIGRTADGAYVLSSETTRA